VTVVRVVRNSDLGLEHSDFAKRDVSLFEVFVVLEWVVSWVKVVVRRSVGLFEAGELLAHLHLALQHSAEIPSGEEAVLRHPVVHGVGFVVVVVLEIAGVGVAEVERHESIPIVDGVQIFALHELFQIVLHNWGLGNSSCFSSSSVNSNAITESENVLESLVLQS